MYHGSREAEQVFLASRYLNGGAGHIFNGAVKLGELSGYLRLLAAVSL